MTAPADKEPVLVSACLLGYRCRYNNKCLDKRELPVSEDRMVPVCPEQLGGLPTPRTPSFFDHERAGDGVLDGMCRVVSASGEDRTGAFLDGARRTLAIARAHGIRVAYLKERSPSCGCREVYLGPDRVSGRGVTTALLARNGITVIPVD